MKQIDFPYRFDTLGGTAQGNLEKHIRDMIEQILFTIPGERVNRPTFGSGLSQLVFGPNSPELASAVQVLVQGALQQWLGDVIQVNSLQVTSDEARLTVTVSYIILRSQRQATAQLTRETA
jgi:hypothetical protein